MVFMLTSGDPEVTSTSSSVQESLLSLLRVHAPRVHEEVLKAYLDLILQGT